MIQGQCIGGSVGNQVRDWINQNLALFIGLVAGIGGLIVLSIIGCCWRSYKRRRNQKAYAANAAAYRGPPPQYYGPPPSGSRSRSRGRRGPNSPTGSGGAPLMTQPGGAGGMWAPQTGHAGGQVPMPPPVHRSNSIRYA